MFLFSLVPVPVAVSSVGIDTQLAARRYPVMGKSGIPKGVTLLVVPGLLLWPDY